MQGQSETFRDFSKRTEALALRLGVNVEDLIDVIGVSRASLFSYRTGNRPISSKAWAKLEQAEKEAGICTSFEEEKTPYGDRTVSGRPADEPSLHQIRADLTKLTACMERLSTLSENVERLARAMENMDARLVAHITAEISDQDGTDSRSIPKKTREAG